MSMDTEHYEDALEHVQKALGEDAPVASRALTAYFDYVALNGYEVVKREDLKRANDAYMLQQVRNGNFSRTE